MVTEDVHHDREGENVRAHDEDEEHEAHDLDDPAASRSGNYLAGVGIGANFGMSHLKLVGDVACVTGSDSDDEEQDDAWQKAESRYSVWESEDAEGDGLSDHDYGVLTYVSHVRERP